MSNSDAEVHRNHATRRAMLSGSVMIGYLAFQNRNGGFAAMFSGANASEAFKMGAISAAADMFTYQLLNPLLGTMHMGIPQTKLVPVVGITPLGLTEAAVAGAGVGALYTFMYPQTIFDIRTMVLLPAGMDLAAQMLGAVLYNFQL
jgi:hypothetical protein